MKTVADAWGLQCPNCGRDDAIDIKASLWVRVTPEGTDPDEAQDGDHEWDDRDAAHCCACHWSDSVAGFRMGRTLARRNVE